MHGSMRTAVAAAALLLAAPAYAETRTIELPAFTAIDVSSGINATISVGGTQSIEAEAKDAKLLDELQVRVEDGVLKAYIDWNLFDLFSFGPAREINVRIVAPTVTSVEASAGADVDAAGVSGDSLEFNVSSGADLSLTGVAGKSVSLNASSGADLRVEGSCETGEIDASSGSDIRADELLCAIIDVNASSGSDIEVFAGKAVKANASSGSEIDVHGNPASVENEESSGGDINIGA